MFLRFRLIPWIHKTGTSLILSKMMEISYIPRQEYKKQYRRNPFKAEAGVQPIVNPLKIKMMSFSRLYHESGIRIALVCYYGTT